MTIYVPEKSFFGDRRVHLYSLIPSKVSCRARITEDDGEICLRSLQAALNVLKVGNRSQVENISFLGIFEFSQASMITDRACSV